MGKGKLSKRPPPSYKEGKLRDPSIKKMQDTKYGRGDLARLVKRAVKADA